jgi:hypothetical protein
MNTDREVIAYWVRNSPPRHIANSGVTASILTKVTERGRNAPMWLKTAKVLKFDTPQKAADALIDAADKFGVQLIEDIFGSNGDDIVLSGECP